MSALLAPLFAQLVTLSVADRTEARYLRPYVYKYEASNRPSLILNLRWRRSDVSAGYSPSFTLAPLEHGPRDLLTYHTAFVGYVYRLRHTSLSLSSIGSFGDMNFRAQLLGDPTLGRTTTNDTKANGMQGATAGSGTQTGEKPSGPTAPSAPAVQPLTRVSDLAVRYGSWSASFGLAHQLNREWSLTALGVETVAGGLDRHAKETYPLMRGSVLGVGAAYSRRITGRSRLTTLATLQQAWSSSAAGPPSSSGRVAVPATHTSVTSLTGSEGITHPLNARAVVAGSVGLSATRTPLPSGWVANSVFPTANLSITDGERFARGRLLLSMMVFSAPVLDPLRATVDPRLGTSANVGFSRSRFSLQLSVLISASAAPSGNNLGAFDNRLASAVASYRVTDWCSVDTGGRLAQQRFQGTTTVPLTYAAFVGLSFAATRPIAGNGTQPRAPRATK